MPPPLGATRSPCDKMRQWPHAPAPRPPAAPPCGRRHRDGGRRARGFTLLELMLVATMLGILMAIGGARVDLGRYRGDAAAYLVRATLQQAQRYALVRQHDMIVSFDTARQFMRLAEDRNNDRLVQPGEVVLLRSLEDASRFAAPPQRVAGGGGGAIQGAQLQSMNGLPTVIFRRDGSASSDLEVYIRTSARHEELRAVLVRRSTGRAITYRRHKGEPWSLAR